VGGAELEEQLARVREGRHPWPQAAALWPGRQWRADGRNHYLRKSHLYLVALDRYLRWRQPGYQAEQHLGGYLYVFCGGCPAPRPRWWAQSDPRNAV